MKSRPSVKLPLRLARYLQADPAACWKWHGAKNEHGYGVIGRGGRGQGVAKAHRIIYELFHGVSLERSVKVLHRCDNPSCVNPLHLFAGTQLENIADMRRKGRGAAPPLHFGEKNPSAKLDEAKVAEIFRLRKTGLTTYRLADHFGVSRSAVCYVLNRQTWRHVDVPNHLC